MPYFIAGSSFFEMYHWLTIGEAVQNGHMYYNIFDTTAPFAATSYWLLTLLFGKSILALHILGGLLLVVQAIIFNSLTINNKIYSQNTYLPVFTFLIISSIHYSLSVFSPVQLGMTFILLAFGKLLSHVEFRAKRDEHIMSIGLLTGVGSLFYLPLILFLPVILIILLIFTTTIKRRYAILISSTLIPLVIAFSYYWVVNDIAGYFFENFILPTLTIDFSFFTNFFSHGIIFSPMLFLLVLGFLTLAKHRRLNNYQIRLAQLFIITGFMVLSVLIFKDTMFFTGFIILLPIAAFFTTHLFFLVTKPMPDLFFSILFVGVFLVLSYDSEFNFIGIVNKPIESEMVHDPGLIDIVANEKLMILGDDQQLYRYGSLATPFYNWELAKPVVDNLNYYDNLVFIKESIGQYGPTIIIDKEQLWPKISRHIPQLATEYKLIRPGIWQRIN